MQRRFKMYVPASKTKQRRFRHAEIIGISRKYLQNMLGKSEANTS